jgi:hypothetical protein
MNNKVILRPAFSVIWQQVRTDPKPNQAPAHYFGKETMYSIERREWSDGMLDSAKRILGMNAFVEATPEQDMNEATDLVTLKMIDQDFRVAVRIRDFKYIEQYPFEFTIRSYSRYGQSEYEKIMGGYAKWFLYAFANPEGTAIRRYLLIDLDVLRKLFNEPTGDHWDATGMVTMPDGSQFKYFEVDRLPRELIVDASHYPEGWNNANV